MHELAAFSNNIQSGSHFYTLALLVTKWSLFKLKDIQFCFQYHKNELQYFMGQETIPCVCDSMYYNQNSMLPCFPTQTTSFPPPQLNNLYTKLWGTSISHRIPKECKNITVHLLQVNFMLQKRASSEEKNSLYNLVERL